MSSNNSDVEKLKHDPVAYAKHKALDNIFERSYSSYGKINESGDNGILMRKDRFIEVVSRLMESTPIESDKVAEAIKHLEHQMDALSRMTKDSYMYREDNVLHLVKIISILKGVSDE